MSYFYAIRIKNTNYVKLGKADNVAARVKELQCANPLELVIEHTFETNDPRDMESRCLKVLRKKRIRGEWYEIDTVALATILAQVYEDHKTTPAVRYQRKKRTFVVTLKNGNQQNVCAYRKDVRSGVLLFYDKSDNECGRFARGVWRCVDFGEN